MNKNKIRKKLAYKLMFLLIQVRCLLTSMMQILYLKVEVLKSEQPARVPVSQCFQSVGGRIAWQAASPSHRTEPHHLSWLQAALTQIQTEERNATRPFQTATPWCPDSSQLGLRELSGQFKMSYCELGQVWTRPWPNPRLNSSDKGELEGGRKWL